MMMLRDQVALITGSSRGIGRQMALRMAEAGAAVVVNGTDVKRVAGVAEEIREKGGRAVAVCCDVGAMQSGRDLVDAALSSFGKLDLVVNNAGVIRDGRAQRLTEEDWDEVMRVHLKGAFAVTQPAVEHMIRRGEGGAVINVTSSAGLTGSPGQWNYSTAKAGLIGMTLTLAMELKRHRIRCNAIAPAALTDMTRPYVEKARRKAEEKNEPFPSYWKIGSPGAAANLAVALAKNTEPPLSGRIFSVNGGRIGLWHPSRHQVLAEKETEWEAESIHRILGKWSSAEGAETERGV